MFKLYRFHLLFTVLLYLQRFLDNLSDNIHNRWWTGRIKGHVWGVKIGGHIREIQHTEALSKKSRCSQETQMSANRPWFFITSRQPVSFFAPLCAGAIGTRQPVLIRNAGTVLEVEVDLQLRSFQIKIQRSSYIPNHRGAAQSIQWVLLCCL